MPILYNAQDALSSLEPKLLYTDIYILLRSYFDGELTFWDLLYNMSPYLAISYIFISVVMFLGYFVSVINKAAMIFIWWFLIKLSHFSSTISKVFQKIASAIIEILQVNPKIVGDLIRDIWRIMWEEPVIKFESDTTIYLHDYNLEILRLCKDAIDEGCGSFFIKCSFNAQPVGYVCHNCVTTHRITTFGYATMNCPTCGFERHDVANNGREIVLYEIEAGDRPGHQND